VVLEAVPELNTVLPVALSHEKGMILHSGQLPEPKEVEPIASFSQ
jgi:hypothetical protein